MNLKGKIGATAVTGELFGATLLTPGMSFSDSPGNYAAQRHLQHLLPSGSS